MVIPTAVASTDASRIASFVSRSMSVPGKASPAIMPSGTADAGVRNNDTSTATPALNRAKTGRTPSGTTSTDSPAVTQPWSNGHLTPEERLNALQPLITLLAEQIVRDVLDEEA